MTHSRFYALMNSGGSCTNICMESNISYVSIVLFKVTLRQSGRWQTGSCFFFFSSDRLISKDGISEWQWETSGSVCRIHKSCCWDKYRPGLFNELALKTKQFVSATSVHDTSRVCIIQVKTMRASRRLLPVTAVPPSQASTYGACTTHRCL